MGGVSPTGGLWPFCSHNAQLTCFFKKKVFLVLLGLHCCTGFSLDVVNGGYSLLCVGFSFSWLLLLQSAGCRARGLQWLQLPGPRSQAQ